MEAIETSFHQDLNGDGLIGPTTAVIEANGSTTVTEIGNQYYLFDSNCSGASLKYRGPSFAGGQFGAPVVPIAAEATASGYEVAWKVLGTNQYSVWTADSNGNYISNIIGTASATDRAPEAIETSFHQDLNGDGAIAAATEAPNAAGD